MSEVAISAAPVTDKALGAVDDLRAAQARLRVAQRSLARKKRGSHRRHKQCRRVARLHEKVANVRRNFQHQTAHQQREAHDVDVDANRGE